MMKLNLPLLTISSSLLLLSSIDVQAMNNHIIEHNIQEGKKDLSIQIEDQKSVFLQKLSPKYQSEAKKFLEEVKNLPEISRLNILNALINLNYKTLSKGNFFASFITENMEVGDIEEIFSTVFEKGKNDLFNPVYINSLVTKDMNNKQKVQLLQQLFDIKTKYGFSYCEAKRLAVVLHVASSLPKNPRAKDIFEAIEKVSKSPVDAFDMNDYLTKKDMKFFGTYDKKVSFFLNKEKKKKEDISKIINRLSDFGSQLFEDNEDLMQNDKYFNILLHLDEYKIDKGEITVKSFSKSGSEEFSCIKEDFKNISPYVSKFMNTYTDGTFVIKLLQALKRINPRELKEKTDFALRIINTDDRVDQHRGSNKLKLAILNKIQGTELENLKKFINGAEQIIKKSVIHDNKEVIDILSELNHLTSCKLDECIPAGLKIMQSDKYAYNGDVYTLLETLKNIKKNNSKNFERVVSATCNIMPSIQGMVRQWRCLPDEALYCGDKILNLLKDASEEKIELITSCMQKLRSYEYEQDNSHFGYHINYKTLEENCGYSMRSDRSQFSVEALIDALEQFKKEGNFRLVPENNKVVIEINEKDLLKKNILHSKNEDEDEDNIN